MPEFVKYVKKPPMPSFSERLKEIERIVAEWKRHKHYRRHGLKLRDVAAELGVSTCYLSNYVNTVEGMNFSAWLNSLRIEEAKRIMLKHPEMPIYEVGYKVGHPRYESFKKAFLTLTNETPEEWHTTNTPTPKND